MASLVEVWRQAVGGYEELTNDQVTKATGLGSCGVRTEDNSSVFDLAEM